MKYLLRPLPFIAVFASVATLSVILLLNIPRPSKTQRPAVRVPAEWEPHAATWMQWPSEWEAEMRPAFADIIKVIQRYEPVHLLTSSTTEQVEAQRFLSEQGVPDTHITWHIIPVDNAWMRDNGPIYVTDGTNTWIQNWKFDAWGGNWGPGVGYTHDNRVPNRVAGYLGIEAVSYQEYVLEKGNLESNGAGLVVLNWDCQNHRNPGMTQAEHEAILKEVLGATRILWAYGYDPEDGTTGHIDGTARFVDHNTIVVADYEGSETEHDLALAATESGLTVVRYPGNPNWLVGNGFVAAMGEGDSTFDAELQAYLEDLFPGRDIHLINAQSIADAGGGIHCVTNDQPVIPAY